MRRPLCVGRATSTIPTLFLCLWKLWTKNYIYFTKGIGKALLLIMNGNPLLRIFTLLAFCAFAAVSCWATAESLHLLLPSFPTFMCWVVSIGFFFIASYGTKMIVDSLNQKIYLENRGIRLIGGVIILLVFWLACSMPTNTHTFFFRSLINDKVSKDISTTEGYLVQIRDNVTTQSLIQQKQSQLENDVNVKLGELKAEIMNDANPGFGSNAKRILKEFADIFGVAKIDPLSYRGTTKQDRERLCDEYRQKMYILMETKKDNIKNQLTPSNNNHQIQADKDYKNLELVKKYVEEGTLSLTDANDINTICGKLDDGYATIRTYNQFVQFKNDAEKVSYTASNSVTKVKQLISVFDVWREYIKGEYAGHGFFFWVIISILVDVAAFIFFDIAFKKRED